MSLNEPERFFCRHPDPEKEGANIAAWKFMEVRSAIVATLAEETDGTTFGELIAEVRRRLSADTIDRLGSVSWHTTVVKLHLEAVAEIERIPDVRPQRLRLAGSSARGG